MILLRQANSDKLQLRTSTSASIDVIGECADVASGSPPSILSPVPFGLNIATAADTDIIATPGTGNIRNVINFWVTNRDASLSCDVRAIKSMGASPVQYLYPKFTLAPGECLQFTEQLGFLKITDDSSAGEIAKVLTSDDAGGVAGTGVQPWFPTNGTLTVPAAKTYKMEGMLWITSGATSHATQLSFGGTATFTSLDYLAKAWRSAAATLSTTPSGVVPISSASATTVDTAGTAVGHWIEINGILRINAAGTLIPQFNFSVNPTGTITIKRNACFRLKALGDNTFLSQGAWS